MEQLSHLALDWLIGLFTGLLLGLRVNATRAVGIWLQSLVRPLGQLQRLLQDLDFNFSITSYVGIKKDRKICLGVEGLGVFELFEKLYCTLDQEDLVILRSQSSQLFDDEIDISVKGFQDFLANLVRAYAGIGFSRKLFEEALDLSD